MNIKSIRKSLGLTQIQFAKELGMTQGSLTNYERGVTPVPTYIEKLIELYIEVSGSEDLIAKVTQLEAEKVKLKNEIKKIDQDIENSKASPRRRPGGSVLGLEGAK